MTRPSPPALPTAFVGDSHLLGGDGSTDAFCELVATAPRRFARLVLVGDIFDLWLARPHLHEPHHRQALRALAEAAESGLAIDYVVGNRDYGVETLHPSPFARVGSERLVAPEAGDAACAWIAEHGDLVNTEDVQYRRWRRLSRSRLVLGSFLALPATIGVPLSQALERRMRTTNLDRKREFPTEHVRACAERHFAASDARFLVLGHFHVEKRIPVTGGEVIVLPDWKRARRHAEWRAGPDGGTLRIVDS